MFIWETTSALIHNGYFCGGWKLRNSWCTEYGRFYTVTPKIFNTSILKLCCTYISLYLLDWRERGDESPIFVLTQNNFIGEEIMLYDIGKSETTLVNMQNSQQNRPQLKSLDSEWINT